MDVAWLASFKAIFLGIFLEALPFILVGVLISSVIHVYLPEKWMQRHIPKNPLLGMLYAIGFGFIFPICECGIIPVIKRLVQKGMPLYMGVVLLIVGPIFNPIVLLATYTAFQSHPMIFYLRIIIAILIGLRVGLSFTFNTNAADFLKAPVHRLPMIQSPTMGGKTSHLTKIKQVLTHTVDEFFEMGTYLLIGSLLTAIIQVAVPRDVFALFSDGLIAHFFMMVFAYVLSLCSTSDAFVAYSFWNAVNHKALLTFLVFGPMLDIKSTLMLVGAFKKAFVVKYISLVVLLVSIAAVILELFVNL